MKISLSVTTGNLTVSLTAARLPFWGVALVHMGMLTVLDQFMLGTTLGHSMSYSHTNERR